MAQKYQLRGNYALDRSAMLVNFKDFFLDANFTELILHRDRQLIATVNALQLIVAVNMDTDRMQNGIFHNSKTVSNTRMHNHLSALIKLDIIYIGKTIQKD